MPIDSKECFAALTEDGQLWEIYQAAQSGGGGITSINGDTTAAQLISGTAPITASTAAGTTTISTSMNTARLLGRTTTGVGVAEEITVGTGLSLSAGTLSSTVTAGVTNVTATAPLTSSGGATPDISTSIATNRIVGRSTAGTGVMEQLTPVGITVSGGNITGIGGTVGTVDNAVPRADGTGGFTLQSSPASISDVNTSLQTTVAIGPDRTTFSITGNAGTDVITATGHNFVTNQAVSFPTLTGGSGLNDYTRYFVRDVTASTFKVSTTIGGGAIDFTTNITAGTVRSAASLVLLQGNQYALESIQTAIPDGTAVGGNARGLGAVDLSMYRAVAADVASGTNSFVGPGYAGRAAGGWSAAIACYDTQANGIYSFAAQRGAISETNSSTAIGFNARANTNAGPAAVGGWSNTSSGIRSGVFGGEENEANNSYSGTLAGYQALSSRYGMHSHAAGQFSSKGDAQRARFVLRCLNSSTSFTNPTVDTGTDIITATGSAFSNGQPVMFTALVGGTGLSANTVYYVRDVSGATFKLASSPSGTAIDISTTITSGTLLTGTEMALDGATTYLSIPQNKVIALTANISGTRSTVSAGSSVAHYIRQYAVKNVSATSTQVYSPVTIGTDNAAGTQINLLVADSDETVRITVFGVAGETWRWVASVDAVEIGW